MGSVLSLIKVKNELERGGDKVKLNQKHFLYFIFLSASSLLLSNCVSHQYRMAQQNKEKPWGKCIVEAETKHSDPFEVFELKLAEPDGGEKVWLEGHYSFLSSSNDKWQVTVRSERDKKASGDKCISSLDVRRNGISYSQITNILLDCESQLEISSEFKSTLRTSNDKWFSLSLNCSK